MVPFPEAFSPPSQGLQGIIIVMFTISNCTLTYAAASVHLQSIDAALIGQVARRQQQMNLRGLIAATCP